MICLLFLVPPTELKLQYNRAACCRVRSLSFDLLCSHRKKRGAPERKWDKCEKGRRRGGERSVFASSWRQTEWLRQRDLFWLDSTTLSPSDLWHLISPRPHLLCSPGNNIPQINNKPAQQAVSREHWASCTFMGQIINVVSSIRSQNVSTVLHGHETLPGFVCSSDPSGFIRRVFAMQIGENCVCLYCRQVYSSAAGGQRKSAVFTLGHDTGWCLFSPQSL